MSTATPRNEIGADDCRSCGACCGPPYPADSYIDLTPLDLARLSRGDRRHLAEGNAPALATAVTDDGVVCSALRGRIGTRVRCTIYERRPDACRRFEPGSRGCRRMRAHAALDY
jgi:Fe-S-cluster containining protein